MTLIYFFFDQKYSILLTQLETNLDSTIEALKIAKESGVITILNTGSIVLVLPLISYNSSSNR